MSKGETRSHKLGRKIAENILETGNLFYNDRTKANFFRGIMWGLMKHEWIRKIIKEDSIYYDDLPKPRENK